MTKIDYSQYYYERGHLHPEREQTAHVKNQEEIPYQRYKRYKNTGKRGKSLLHRFFILLLILAILCGVFFGVNYALDGKAVEAVKSFISNREYKEYYFVVKEEMTREKIYAHSLLIRQGGAGGYVYGEGEKYYAVYTVVADADGAKSVVEKNKNTKSVKKTVWSNDKRVFRVITVGVDTLIDACERYETGQIYETELLEIYAKLRAEIITLKQILYEEGSHEQNAMDFLLGGLDSKEVTSSIRTEVTASIRYTVAGTVYNATLSK